MGADEQGRRCTASLGSGCRGPRPATWWSVELTEIVQVVPDIASFAVDDGFAYSVPDAIESPSIGSIVRVPLGGRRVRGWVVARPTSARAKRLKDVISVSGEAPVFDRALLETLRWVSLHYVAPLATVLPRAGPPNLPRGRVAESTGPVPQVASPLPDFSHALLAGGRPRLHHLLATGGWGSSIAGLASGVVAAGGNVAVVVPTLLDVEALGKQLTERFGDRVMTASSGLSDAAVTSAWMAMNLGRGMLLVGTREIAMWSLGRCALAIVVEPGRRVMKAPQSPTVHVRDVLRRRAAIERFGYVTMGPVPPLETVAAGAAISKAAARAWPLVEVLDRSQEPPGAGLVIDAARRAIRGAVARDERVFVYVSRRGYAPAFRCLRCRTLRRCPMCGAGPDRGDSCRRCGERLGPCQECSGKRFEPLGAGAERIRGDLARSLGAAVGGPGDSTPVRVGTERDLPRPGTVDLAVAVDVDTLLLAAHYRAEEEALRILARLVGTVRRGRGHRAVLQTSQPEHRIVLALRHGDPMPVIAELLAERELIGLPPTGDLIAVEVRGDAALVDAELRASVGDDGGVFGPAELRDRSRWLIQGRSLHATRVMLRGAVQRWRDLGFRVRVDADPIDL